MPTSILGAPTHALLVHGVAVLVPLSVLGVLLTVLWPAFARRYGGLVALVAVVSVPLTALAASAGEDLERQVRASDPSAQELDLMEQHTRLGDSLLPWVIVLAVGALALALLEVAIRERSRTDRPAGGGGVATRTRTGRLTDRWVAVTERVDVAVLVRVRWVAVVVALVGAVLGAYFVVRIGHLGAEAAWSRLAQR